MVETDYRNKAPLRSGFIKDCDHIVSDDEIVTTGFSLDYDRLKVGDLILVSRIRTKKRYFIFWIPTLITRLGQLWLLTKEQRKQPDVRRWARYEHAAMYCGNGIIFEIKALRNGYFSKLNNYATTHKISVRRAFNIADSEKRHAWSRAAAGAITGRYSMRSIFELGMLAFFRRLFGQRIAGYILKKRWFQERRMRKREIQNGVNASKGQSYQKAVCSAHWIHTILDLSPNDVRLVDQKWLNDLYEFKRSNHTGGNVITPMHLAMWPLETVTLGWVQIPEGAVSACEKEELA